MKLSASLAFLGAPVALAGLGWSSFSSSSAQRPMLPNNEDLSVPGANPLLFCADPADDLLTIDHVDLTPNPPEAGTKLVITASGTLHKTIEPGAKVHLQVKFGLITLINQEADLCEQTHNVDLECPLESGNQNLTKEVELPRQIPPGRYTVLADVYTREKKKITCLTAAVAFYR